MWMYLCFSPDLSRFPYRGGPWALSHWGPQAFLNLIPSLSLKNGVCHLSLVNMQWALCLLQGTMKESLKAEAIFPTGEQQNLSDRSILLQHVFFPNCSHKSRKNPLKPQCNGTCRLVLSAAIYLLLVLVDSGISQTQLVPAPASCLEWLVLVGCSTWSDS